MTGLDYAEQRFYASTYGRFNTPDPYMASGGPASPASWNRYSYTRGDPINRFDPMGREDCDPSLDPDAVGLHALDDCGGEGGGGGGGCFLDCSPDPDPDPGPGPDPGPQPGTPPPPSCSISVATGGTPRDGQNLVGLTLYSPTKNTLGPYSTVGRPGTPPNYQGWYSAVQIQANLSGDTNPLDWTATQTVSSSGTIRTRPLGGPVQVATGTTGPTPDNPTFGVNTGTTGRLDWLDEPGLPKYFPGGGIVVGASLTQTFISTVSDGSASCSVSWTNTIQVPPGSSVVRTPFKPRRLP